MIKDSLQSVNTSSTVSVTTPTLQNLSLVNEPPSIQVAMEIDQAPVTSNEKGNDLNVIATTTPVENVTLSNSNTKTNVILTQATHSLACVTVPPLTYEIYDIHDTHDIDRLVKHCEENGMGFVYDNDYNANHDKIKLSICYNAILKQYCVVTNEDLEPSNDSILAYAAVLFPEDQENLNSHYRFAIEQKKKGSKEKVVTHVLDAIDEGDVTRFINHSDTPNLSVKQIIKNGVPKIYFYVAKPIKAGEQLTFDYTRNYFNMFNFNPLFLYKTDTHIPSAKIYHDNKEYYVEGTFIFNEETQKTLQLKPHQWLIPKAFLYIIQKDHQGLIDFLKENPDMPIDLRAYAYKNNEILDASEQQHLTPLMLACYLGDAEMAQTLIDHDADIDHCMLITGYTPISLLLMGKAGNEIVNSFGIELLKSSVHPYILDKDQLTLLHYAIVRDAQDFVKEYLQMANKDNINLFNCTLKRRANLPEHASLDFCLKNGKFKMLEILLDEIKRSKVFFNGKFKKLINKNKLLTTETLDNMSVESLNQLKQLLNKRKYSTYFKNTNIQLRIDNAIHKKLSSQDEAQSINNLSNSTNTTTTTTNNTNNNNNNNSNDETNNNTKAIKKRKLSENNEKPMPQNKTNETSILRDASFFAKRKFVAPTNHKFGPNAKLARKSRGVN